MEASSSHALPHAGEVVVPRLPQLSQFNVIHEKLIKPEEIEAFDPDVRGSLDLETGQVPRPHSPAPCGSRGVE